MRLPTAGSTLSRLRDSLKAIVGRRKGRTGLQVTAPVDLTAVIYTLEPSHFFDRCYASIQRQTLPANAIEVVRNISPVSVAVRAGLERVQTQFCISIDDDMILRPECFRRLYEAISIDDNCAEVIMQLEDPILGPIFGVRIYRTCLIRSAGFPPVEDKGWDRAMHARLEKAGFRTVKIRELAGLHHPVYLPHEAFWKYRFIGEKVRYYENGLTTMSIHLDHVAAYWQRTRDIIAIYALAGLFDGLQSDDIGQPLNYDGRDSYGPFLKVKHFIENH